MSKYQEALFGQVVKALKDSEDEATRCDEHEVFIVSDKGCPGCSERTRIIKLLEDEYDNKDENGVCIYERHMPECCNCDLIALIKGENK